MTQEETLSFDDTITALAQACVVFRQDGRGLVRVRGRDARVFLHRLSTQYVVDRASSTGVLNTFLDKKGRMRFLTHHVTLADDNVLLVAGVGEGRALADWLESFHFAEELTIDDVTGLHRVSMVAGRGALVVLGSFVIGAHALSPFDARAENGVTVVRTFDLRVDENGPIAAAIVVEDAGQPSVLLFPTGALDALESARIAALVPLCGHEVTDAVNPLELGLTSAIHWDKGCYTGQEVISRIENRGKQGRYLVGLVVDEAVAEGDEIRSGGDVLGTVTSVSPRPIDALPRALAILRTREDLDGNDVRVASATREISARVVRAAH
jgi:folate-binding protein YgfZ